MTQSALLDQQQNSDSIKVPTLSFPGVAQTAPLAYLMSRNLASVALTVVDSVFVPLKIHEYRGGNLEGGIDRPKKYP
jgi:hypothetical protein